MHGTTRTVPRSEARGICRRRFILPALIAPALAATTISFRPVGDGGAIAIDQTRATLEKWVEARRLISREAQEWSLARETLDQRIELVGREIELLRGKITDVEASLAEADGKRAEAVAQGQGARDVAETLRKTVAALETRTRELLPKLPDPIRDRVEPLSERFPKSSEDSKASLSERFQNVAGVLNEVGKFDGEITLTTEVRPLGDGTRAEVVTFYLGLGQGYYVSGDGRSAGVGGASSDGWTWRSADESAPAVARAIAILENEVAAEFVRLPMRVE